MKRLYPRLSGIDKNLLRNELRDALRRFCIESEIWRYVFEVLPVEQGEQVYRIAEQEGTKIVRVESLFYACESGQEIKIPERQDVQQNMDSFQYWYESEPSMIVLNEKPEEDDQYRANVILRPVDGGERFPIELFERWKEIIHAGAMAELYAMPNKTWSNIDLANLNNGKWLQGVADAKRKHLQDMKPDRPAYRSPYSF